MNFFKKTFSAVILSAVLITNIAPSYASDDYEVGTINDSIMASDVQQIEAYNNEEFPVNDPEAVYYKRIDNGIKGIHEQLTTGAFRQMLTGSYSVTPRDNKPGYSVVKLEERHFNMRGQYTYKEIYDAAADVIRIVSTAYHKGSGNTFYYMPKIYAYDVNGNYTNNENDRIYKTLITFRYTIPTKKVGTLKQEADWIRSFSKTRLKGLSPYKKIVYTHDWITNNAYYKTEAEDPYEFYTKYDSYTLITKGYGVCNAYAGLMQKIMVYNNIRALFIIGDSWESGNRVGHAWNKFYVDGKWTNVDVTWDDPIGNPKGKIRRKYFMIPDSAFNGKREFNYKYFPRG